MAIEIFNEICLLLTSYLLLEFTQYEQDGKFRYGIGWIVTSIMIIVLVINSSLFVFRVG